MGGDNPKNIRKINFEKLSDFIRNPNFKPLEKVIIVDILLYAGTNREPFPSQKTLGNDLGRTARQIRNALSQLKAKRKLSWRRRGFSKSNQYLVNEEFYIHYEDANAVTERKQITFDGGIGFPSNEGNSFPANEYKDNELKRNEDNYYSFPFKNKKNLSKPVFNPCGKCKNGILFSDDPDKPFYYCKCKEKYNLELKDWEEQ